MYVISTATSERKKIHMRACAHTKDAVAADAVRGQGVVCSYILASCTVCRVYTHTICREGRCNALEHRRATNGGGHAMELVGQTLIRHTCVY